MNLIIEQGNTTTKVAVFNENGGLEETFQFKQFTPSCLTSVFKTYSPDKGILSTVVDIDPELLFFLNDRLNKFIILDEHLKLPVKVAYEEPSRLGKDRLAAVVGAYYQQPDRNLLVIDAGTAITYEFLDAAGVYHGGNISPGMTTRFKALNLFTKKLPLVCETENIPLLGKSTEDAIRAGVVQGISFEMDGYINEMKAKYPDLFVFLTGGHSFYFERRLKNSIFADINLVMAGLNRILECNVEN